MLIDIEQYHSKTSPNYPPDSCRLPSVSPWWCLCVLSLTIVPVPVMHLRPCRTLKSHGRTEKGNASVLGKFWPVLEMLCPFTTSTPLWKHPHEKVTCNPTQRDPVEEPALAPLCLVFLWNKLFFQYLNLSSSSLPFFLKWDKNWKVLGKHLDLAFLLLRPLQSSTTGNIKTSKLTPTPKFESKISKQWIIW